MRTLIHNAHIVNENRQFDASVVIEDELIADIIEGNDNIDKNAFDYVIDATGLYLLPGVIDDHVHFREPGLTYKADIESESRTATAGTEICPRCWEKPRELLVLFRSHQRQPQQCGST